VLKLGTYVAIYLPIIVAVIMMAAQRKVIMLQMIRKKESWGYREWIMF